MKPFRIIHRTEYHYRQPVGFSPHRMMMRPREGHDIRIVQGRFDVEPKANVRWLRDIYNNSDAHEDEADVMKAVTPPGRDDHRDVRGKSNIHHSGYRSVL